MLKRLWDQLSLATLLATALATFWGLLIVWGVATYETRANRNREYEELVVDANGDAWLKVNRIVSGFMSATESPYRTLDGEPIPEPDHSYWLSESHLVFPEESNWGNRDFHYDWGRRVQQLSRLPGEIWYVMHNGRIREDGKCYLVGYDLRSNLPLGYCSRLGFRTELPKEQDWFRIDGRTMGYLGGGITVLSAWKEPVIGLATADGWFQFDVRQRKFAALDEQNVYYSCYTCTVPWTMLSQEPEFVEREKTLLERESNSLVRGPEVIVLRQAEQIVIQNPAGEKPFEFSIPESYRERNFMCYLVSADQAVLQIGQRWNQEEESLLVTINSAGDVLKTQQIHWTNNSQVSGKVAMTLTSVIAPAPLAQATILNLLAITHQGVPYSGWQEVGHFQRLAMLLGDAWPSMLVLYTVALALTWLEMQWHKRYARANSKAWAAFVFLLGVPGFFAYWLYHRRPSLENCDACHEPVPRDRNICARCRQPFPEPSLTGTEVFA